MTIPFAVPECRVAHLVERHDDHLVVPVRLDAATGCCPECGQASRSVHGRYHRHPADLPLSASRTTLRIEVRRFYCLNPTCRRRTFAQTPTDLLAPRARRTRRLCEARARVGRACGGAGGARLLAHLHMPASRATVLRLVTHLPMPDAPAPIRVGIDDWAIRKGSRYGTIVADLDRRRVVDLLPDRTAPTVAGWLERHSGVALVARDRSTEYARGASLGAPQAQQVADRWHLLTNMRQAVERWLQGAHARLRSLPLLPGSTARPARRDRACARSTTELEAGAQSRMRWQVVYDEVRRRHAGGEPLLGIARALGLARATVRKYASAETFPARLPHGAGPSLLDPHIPYLAARIDEGCENAMALWREIREQGYPGTSRQVHRFVAERRTRPVRSGRKLRCAKACASEPPVSEASLPPARQLAWLLVQPTAVLDEGDAVVVSRVEQDDTAQAVAGLARRFTALVRAAGKGKPLADDQDAAADIVAWITKARTCEASAIATFAAGLEADIAAVRAALTEPWSSGQAEGQVNRLTLIKRQCYGRAGLDLLKRRMVVAA
ncbi:ISL3 family transposase [Methylobacterium indicum]|uniref:ISL3 family transposase n=1 Tax=Methylobacterium indicum TaxID=1775910 RepID=UPI000654149A|nr:ISL3 family transposase [Methylobacterium indicum]KMO20160.1 transposase [Methylobacterium indicum]